ncbi:MAG: phosphatase PAP2 family protein [Ardenticatenales bacterium]|nr:phosphatase PAP2 family protein [Ardenticatenales bacterium]
MNEEEPILNEPNEETRAAAKPVQEQLEEKLAAIDTPEKAEALVEQLTSDAQGQTAESATQQTPLAESAPPEVQAAIAVEAVAQSAAQAPNTPVQEAAAVINAVAAEAEAMEGPAYEAFVEAVQKVTDPSLQGQPEKLEEPRRYLRDAIMQRMSFFQKYDTALFIFINNSPHHPLSNAFFEHLSFWFNGGWAWILGTLLFWPIRRKESTRILKAITLPVWAAALGVEGPIKKYFRRKRPFIDVVRAVVVGKKPGNWSFPSGHAAAAFGGARMMARCLPRWQPLWYSLAALVSFSRVYLGAHYPGDVLSGSLVGVALAEGMRWLMERWKKA